MRLLVATRKGLFRLEHRRDGWHVGEPHFLGVRVTNAVKDPRDGSVWACLGHRHWGPKLSVSRDDGASFLEVSCPAFPEGARIDTDTPWGRQAEKASVRSLLTLAPLGDEGGYLAGTDPGGLFATSDAGSTWTLNEALWRRRNDDGWFPSGGGVMLHTILVDRDRRRLHVAASCGGVYETTDAGATWEPRNRGVPADFLPERYPETGQDTHMLAAPPSDHDLLWQQNHCGNFRSTDGGRTWRDTMPGSPLAFGFAIAVDEGDPEVAWTVPLESDERRVARGGALAVCRTDDGGETWRELSGGLPQRHCYDIVYRHALDARGDAVAFGTTCGRVFASLDRGGSWDLIAPYLPPVSSVRFER